MSNFTNWKLTFTADLVSKYSLEGTSAGCIHENLAKALRREAGSMGYLIANEETRIDQEGEEK